MRPWLRVNLLSLVMFGAFLVFVTLQSVVGRQARNEELAQFGRAADSYWHYLGTGRFGEAVFENWESEFLQMGFYVLLTIPLTPGRTRRRCHGGAVRSSAVPQSLSIAPYLRRP
jgi:hypothetical protein